MAASQVDLSVDKEQQIGTARKFRILKQICLARKAQKCTAFNAALLGRTKAPPVWPIETIGGCHYPAT